MKSRFFIIIAILSAILASCSESSGSLSLRLAVPSMSDYPVEILVGENFSVPVIASPENFDRSAIEISSTAPSIATMNEYFIITANGVGTARITVSKGKHVFFTIDVTVTREYVSSFGLSSNLLCIYPGKSAELEIIDIVPEDIPAACLTWTILPASAPFDAEWHGNVMTIKASSYAQVGDVGEIYFNNEQGLEKSCLLKVVKEPEPVILPDAVDMGLSVKWASLNVGAKSEADPGHYFKWGAMEPSSSFDSYDDYPWYDANGNILKYHYPKDSYIYLVPEDDVATKSYGEGWRHPSEYEMVCLFSLQNAGWSGIQKLTEYKWTSRSFDGKSVYGYEITSLVTGNKIFLPAAGYYDYDTGGKLISGKGAYWLDGITSAWPTLANAWRISESECGRPGLNRLCGLNIRAVYEGN